MSHSPPEASPAALEAPPLLKLCSIFILTASVSASASPPSALLVLLLCFLGFSLFSLFAFRVYSVIRWANIFSFSFVYAPSLSLTLSLSGGLACLAHFVTVLAFLFFFWEWERLFLARPSCYWISVVIFVVPLRFSMNL